MITSPSNGSANESRIEHHYDADTPPSIAIVQAIAALENVEPTDFQPALGIRLADQIDPEALDQLVTTTRGGASIAITMTLTDRNEYDVQVSDTGQIVVRKTE